jgi:hypothetical protein
MMELCLHSLIRLDDFVVNLLSTERTLPVTLPSIMADTRTFEVGANVTSVNLEFWNDF